MKSPSKLPAVARRSHNETLFDEGRHSQRTTLEELEVFKYKCSDEILGLHEFFVEEPASKWCLEAFMSKLIRTWTSNNQKNPSQFDLVSNQDSNIPISFVDS
ncbi:10542_t:CDS:2 [Diversispora eburnea]|uniref:10542_t:CDS:1 n=1 Tax=Diversispora eburnea TaxID=1213867 RepID=A0A9N8Z0L5_9GLOM|nr:10542_t:CDS:2 [Diversispora eburnea]